MLEQRIKVCQHRLSRHRRAEHAHKSAAPATVGAGASKVAREAGSGFKFAANAVKANRLMAAVGAAAKADEKAAEAAPAPPPDPEELSLIHI